MINSNKILCVILHYGDEFETWNCLKSIIVNSDSLDIIIVDNDPLQEIEIPEQLNDMAKLYRTGGNLGFSKANNIAVHKFRNKYHDSVLLLNNDTIVMGDALHRLHELVQSQKIGAAGPCMPFLNNPNQVWACGGRINKFRVSLTGLHTIKSSEPYDVDYLPGAAILCKLNVWDEVDGLPEKYFLACEEAEFALQIRKLNLRVMVDPKAKILHKVGMTKDRQKAYIYNRIRNRLKLGQFIWGPAIGFYLAALMTLVEMSAFRSGFRLWSRAIQDEIRNCQLDMNALQKIRNEFGE